MDRADWSWTEWFESMKAYLYVRGTSQRWIHVWLSMHAKVLKGFHVTHPMVLLPSVVIMCLLVLSVSPAEPLVVLYFLHQLILHLHSCSPSRLSASALKLLLLCCPSTDTLSLSGHSPASNISLMPHSCLDLIPPSDSGSCARTLNIPPFAIKLTSTASSDFKLVCGSKFTGLTGLKLWHQVSLTVGVDFTRIAICARTVIPVNT